MKKKLLFFGHSGNLGSNFIYFLKNDFNFILNINEKKLYFPDVEYIYLSEKDLKNIPGGVAYSKLNSKFGL